MWCSFFATFHKEPGHELRFHLEVPRVWNFEESAARRRNRLGNAERLEARYLLASSATFNAVTGALSVTGDSGDNDLVVSANGQYVYVADHETSIFSPLVLTSDVKSITVFAGDGHDQISLANVSSANYTQLFQRPDLRGEAGNDTVFGSKLADTISGGSGIDGLVGLESSDNLFGGTGNDFLYGDYGNNNALNSGYDELYGEDGDDSLYGDQLNDLLNGGADTDRLFGGNGDDALDGGTGDDYYAFWVGLNLGSDSINEGASAGTDTLDFTNFLGGIQVNLGFTSLQQIHHASPPAGSSLLYLTIANNVSIEQVLGTPSGDFITGNSNANYLGGLGGNDSIAGQGGNDILEGGTGNDIMDGGAGNDLLSGGAGNDEYVFSGSGNLGTDSLTENGGEGIDAVNFTLLASGVSFDLANLSAQEVNSQLTLDLNNTTFEAVFGTAQNDTITGNDASNLIGGGAGDDVLVGGNGDDLLSGGAGNDDLFGGNGNDVLEGGGVIMRSSLAVRAPMTSTSASDSTRSMTSRRELTISSSLNKSKGRSLLTVAAPIRDGQLFLLPLQMIRTMAPPPAVTWPSRAPNRRMSEPYPIRAASYRRGMARMPLFARKAPLVHNAKQKTPLPLGEGRVRVPQSTFSLWSPDSPCRRPAVAGREVTDYNRPRKSDWPPMPPLHTILRHAVIAACCLVALSGCNENSRSGRDIWGKPQHSELFSALRRRVGVRFRQDARRSEGGRRSRRRNRGNPKMVRRPSASQANPRGHLHHRPRSG